MFGDDEDLAVAEDQEIEENDAWYAIFGAVACLVPVKRV